MTPNSHNNRIRLTGTPSNHKRIGIVSLLSQIGRFIVNRSEGKGAGLIPDALSSAIERTFPSDRRNVRYQLYDGIVHASPPLGDALAACP
ncbi:MAG: hypothetical protein NBKEAIPA_02919 [Nitrospirae bacterium]|nr:hypothetical protein [Nitrospirota bacterium]